MAKSLNVVNLTGYLGGEPRYHEFDNGDAVCNLSLAVARQKKQDGEYVEDTVWVEVKVFGGQAKPCSEYLAKGSFIAVSGQLAQPRLWEDNNGETRCGLVVDRASVVFGPRTSGDAGQQSQPQSQPRQQAAPAASRLGDDDIPF